MRRLDFNPAASLSSLPMIHQLLGAWTTRRAARTSIDRITRDRVVSERDDDTVGADSDTVTSVAINLVLVELDRRRACVTGTDAAGAVERDLVVPCENTDRVSRDSISEDTVARVVGEHAITCSHKGAVASVKTVCTSAQSHVVQSDSHAVRQAAGSRIDCVKRVVTYDGVPHIQRKIVGLINGDAVSGIEPEDHAVFHVNGLGLEDVYSVDAITESVNGNTSNSDYVSRGCVDDDTIDEGSQDRSERAATIESDRLGDRHGTKTTWIECVNLTAGRGLGDGASPCFARSGTAAGVSIVPYAGHPCSGGLCLCDRHSCKHEGRDCQNLDREPKLTHF